MNKNWACGKPWLLLISPEQALGQIVNDNGNTIIMAAPTICSGPPTSGVNTFYYLLRPSPLPREAGHPHAADTRAPTRVCAQAGENLWPRFTGQEPEALKKGGHLPETTRSVGSSGRFKLGSTPPAAPFPALHSRPPDIPGLGFPFSIEICWPFPGLSGWV